MNTSIPLHDIDFYKFKQYFLKWFINSNGVDRPWRDVGCILSALLSVSTTSKMIFVLTIPFFFLQRWDKSIPFTVERKVPLNIEKNQWKWEYPRQTENLNPGEHMFHHKELNLLNAYFSIFSLESVSFSLLKGICKYKMVLPHKKNFLRGKFSRFWKNIQDWKEVFVKVEKKILA